MCATREALLKGRTPQSRRLCITDDLNSRPNLCLLLSLFLTHQNHFRMDELGLNMPQMVDVHYHYVYDCLALHCSAIDYKLVFGIWYFTNTKFVGTPFGLWVPISHLYIKEFIRHLCHSLIWLQLASHPSMVKVEHVIPSFEFDFSPISFSSYFLSCESLMRGLRATKSLWMGTNIDLKCFESLPLF